MNANLRVETLSNSLKEVQSAKSSLEDRLNGRRKKRQDAESVLESVNSKLAQVKDLHTKMMETMKMAQHKVVQTQALSDNMEKNNNEKRQSLQTIGQQIKGQGDGRTDDMHTFEEELGKLSRFLIDAKSLYAENKVREQLDDSKKTMERSVQEVIETDAEMVQTTSYFNSLYINNNSGAGDEDNIDKQNIWDIVTAEQRSALLCLQSVNKEIEGLSRAQ